MTPSDELDGRAAIAAAAAGVIAAIALPAHGIGVGIPVTLLAVLGVVAWCRPQQLRGWQLLWSALAIACACIAALSVAPWVLAPALIGSIGLASLAAAGGRSWVGLTSGVFQVLAWLPFAPARLSAPMRAHVDADVKRRARSATRVVLIAGALLAVFGLLFASADRAFAQIAGDLLAPDVHVSSLAARLLALVLAATVAGALLLASRPSREAEDEATSPPEHTLRRIDWMAALIALDLLFVGFVAVQLAALFGGAEFVQRTSGLTYAQYARSGFFQLVWVAALTFGVIGAAVRYAQQAGPRDRLLLRVLLGSLCVLTMVILASAMWRLVLYEETFGFTRLRVSVHVTIAWMAGLFLMVAIALARWRGAWLPRVALLYSVVVFLAFATVRPDAVIARLNLDRLERTGEVDVVYLAGLSPDATPTLARLPEEHRRCVLLAHARRFEQADLWASWNLARERAEPVLIAIDQRATHGCEEVLWPD